MMPFRALCRGKYMRASVRAKQIEGLEVDYNNRMKWAAQSTTWRKKAYHLGEAAKLAGILEKLSQEEHDEQFQDTLTDLVKAEQILSKAAGHLADRAVTYDKPEGERSMGRTVELFNLFYGMNLTEDQGWRFMVFLKMVRSTQGNFKLDNFEDSTAYEALAGEFLAKQEKE